MRVTRVCPGRFGGFLLVSAALIGAAVAASGLVVAEFFERQLLAQEKAQTATVVQVQARQHLTPADFDLHGPSSEDPPFPAFLKELPGVFRMKVFDSASRIVWSDEKRLIGRAFPDNAYATRALTGEVVAVLRAPRKPEHLYEASKGYVAETYTPVTLGGSPHVVGVIETYKDATEMMAGLRRSQLLVWGTTAGVGLLLYCALALVVGRASASEARAMQRLEVQNREIRVAHERLAAILDAMADCLVIVDREMRIVDINRVAREAMAPDDDPRGLSCFQVFGREPDTCEGCPAVRTFESGKVERGVRAQRLPGGRVKYLDLVTAPLRNASGEVDHVLEVARDITGLVEMEDRLKESAGRLEQSNAALLTKTEELERANEALREAQSRLVAKERLAAVGELVVGLHHTILNPLAGIKGALALLRQNGIGSEAKERALMEAEAEVQKMESLVRRLPRLRRTTGAPYVGTTTMLDLQRSLDDEG